MPKQNKMRTLNFPALNGGINLSEAQFRLEVGESPEVVNLWYENGILRSRPGQEWASASFENIIGNPIAYAASPAFHNCIVFHISSYLFLFDQNDEITDADGLPLPRQIAENIPANAGTFFIFANTLFYKNCGGFYKISYDSGVFSVSNVADEAYIPTVTTNASPADGIGQSCQPENCLSAKKRIQYTPTAAAQTVIKTADGGLAFSLDVTEQLRGVESVYIDNTLIRPALYSVNIHTGVVIFNAPPPTDSVITFVLHIGNLDYYLPAQNIEAVEEVVVDGLLMEEGSDYTVDLVSGIVTFTEAPPIGMENSVEIVYCKTNSKSFNAVMNCKYAAVYGANNRLCIVLSGNSERSNSVFWSGNTDSNLDYSYFPISACCLVGDTPITGFGRQYDRLFVFHANSIESLSGSVQSANSAIALTVSRINHTIGCPFPNSIQLIENNLVFCSYNGIFIIRNTSAALENSLVCISRKINGSDERPGLLYDLRVSPALSSHSDGKHYFLSINHHVWLWDYSLSTFKQPIWFYFTDISPAAWFSLDAKTFHLNSFGRVTRFGDVLHDYGEGIRKIFQFPVQNFGSYEHLKDVVNIILAIRADAPSNITMIYESDYEVRRDLTNPQVIGNDRLTERDLTTRNLKISGDIAIFRRRPMCRHVRHFSLRLENETAGEDLALISAQLQYRFL